MVKLPVLLSSRSPLLLPGETWGALIGRAVAVVAGLLAVASVFAVALAGAVGWP